MKALLRSFLLCVVAANCLKPCHAETPAEQALMQASINDGINPKWLTQSWDEKANRPYTVKVLEVERLLQKKVGTSVILRRYEASARKQPTSSLAIFPWVYARYRLVESHKVQKPLSGVCEELYKVLVLAPSPPSAEYARLRFKIEARTHLSSRLRKVGERLVARYRNDQRLLLAYSGVLGDSGDNEAAVRNDYALVKKFPKEPNYRWNLGMDLTTLAWNKRDPKLLDSGESQFNMFEKLAPPNHPLRRNLPNAREYIRIKRLRFAGKTP